MDFKKWIESTGGAADDTAPYIPSQRQGQTKYFDDENDSTHVLHSDPNLKSIAHRLNGLENGNGLKNWHVRRTAELVQKYKLDANKAMEIAYQEFPPGAKAPNPSYQPTAPSAPSMPNINTNGNNGHFNQNQNQNQAY